MNSIKNINEINTNNLRILGHGSYGTVYDYGNEALKKMKNKTGSYTFIREVGLLNELKTCNNISKIKKIITNKDYIGYTMIKYDYTLKNLMGIIHNNPILIKKVIFGILSGIAQCNSNLICHRDIKPTNILLDEDYNVYLCDFGLSKLMYSEHMFYIPEVIQTIWYRAPEVIIKDLPYDYNIDIWSVGIIFLEILSNKHGIISADNDMNMLIDIISKLGKPQKDTTLYNFCNDRHILYSAVNKKIDIEKLCKNNGVCDLGYDLLTQMLEYDKLKRIKVYDALYHPYFDDLKKQNISYDILRNTINFSSGITNYDFLILNNSWFSDSVRVKSIEKIYAIYSKLRIDIISISLIIKYLDIYLSNQKLNENKLDIYVYNIINIFIKLFTEMSFTIEMYLNNITNITLDKKKKLKSIQNEELESEELSIVNSLNYVLFYKTPLFIIKKITEAYIFEEKIKNFMIYLALLTNFSNEFLKYNDVNIISSIIHTTSIIFEIEVYELVSIFGISIFEKEIINKLKEIHNNNIKTNIISEKYNFIKDDLIISSFFKSSEIITG
jgi:serine/threonine protein kinase